MRRITRAVGALPIPDRWAVPLQYRLELGRWPNLKEPQTFNEHLCAAKLDPGAWGLSRYVDKLAARRTAAAALGADSLVPLVGGPWKRAGEVPVKDLPPCALKCTHASHAGLRLAGPLGDAWSLRGGRQVCALKDVGRVLDGWLKRDWYRVARERPYHEVKPRIIAEQWIDGAMDYKVMVFRGRARVIQRHGMDDDQPTIDLYDENGFGLRAGKVGYARGGPAQIDFDRGAASQPSVEPSAVAVGDLDGQRPSNLAARLCLAAEKVAAQIVPAQNYVRVDFLVAGGYPSVAEATAPLSRGEPGAGGRLYFGEITFYDSAGLRDFVPTQINFEMGGWMR